MENSSPVASVAVPSGPLVASQVLAFDGSGSSDPDPNDSVTSFAWTFRAVSAPCAAPTVAGTEPTAQVRFACPGSYAVDLTVQDELSLRSPVATVTFEVVPYGGPTFVEAGADVAVAHACSGAPLLCAPTSPVALSATAPGATGNVTFEWKVTPPPGRELGPTRRVTFVPDQYAPSPTVSIETDGTAISGEWLLEVEARDEAGVLGTAVTRVSVGNGAPVILSSAPTPPHVFDGARFSADGGIFVSVSDPDGDPLPVREAAWHHSGDGASSVFTGSDLVTRLTYGIVVPYSSPADAAFLIDGAGLERSVELAVEDVNGARTREIWPIVVGNHRPVLVSSPASFSIDHTYDITDGAYEVVAPLSMWSDPDGDPLTQVGATGDDVCTSIAITGGRAAVSCSLAFAGTPAVANILGTHVVTERIADPWVEAPANAVTFSISNRSPIITSTSTITYKKCSGITCCLRGTVGQCVRVGGVSRAGMVYVPRFDDPNHDPILVRISSAPGIVPEAPFVCTPPACNYSLSLAEMSICGTVSTTLPMAAYDGVAAVSGNVVVARSCF